MRFFRISSLSLVVLTAILALARSADEPASAKIDRLVKQLGSSTFSEREAAAKELEALGVAALPALRQTLNSSDIEMKRHARELIAAIEQNADSTTVMTPTKVRLQANATPLVEVIRDLARQSKIHLFLDREPMDLEERPVTLDTGETSFWEALDALCRQAKIHLRPDFQEVSSVDASQTENGQVVNRQFYQLVLQDGALPEQPVAYLGSVRLRLLPDRSNSSKKDDRKDRWLVEVLGEPKVHWQGLLFLDWEEVQGTKGERIGSFPIADHTAKDRQVEDEVVPSPGPMMNIFGGGKSLVESGGQDIERSVIRRQIPVKWSLPAGAISQPVTWRGKLKGKALIPPAAVISVGEVLKTNGKRIEGKDGSGLTVKKCDVKADGTAELELDVIAPARANTGLQIEMSNLPLGAEQVKSAGIYVWDTKGRKYDITGGIMSLKKDNVTTYSLILKPPAQDSTLGKLERHAPYPAEIAQTFTLRNVRTR